MSTQESKTIGQTDFPEPRVFPMRGYNRWIFGLAMLFFAGLGVYAFVELSRQSWSSAVVVLALYLAMVWGLHLVFADRRASYELNSDGLVHREANGTETAYLWHTLLDFAEGHRAGPSDFGSFEYRIVSLTRPGPRHLIIDESTPDFDELVALAKAFLATSGRQDLL